MRRDQSSFTITPALSCLLTGILLTGMAGCSGSTPPTNTATPQQGPQNYLAPAVAGTTNGGSPLSGPEIYAIDDFANQFSQTSFLLQPPQQQGSQVINSGMVAASARGLLNLQASVNYVYNSITNVWDATTPPLGNSFAVELAGQAGGLVQLAEQPVAPLVAAMQCPNFTTPQAYQFVTIPGGLLSPSATPEPFAWNPTVDTAYGSVVISTSGNMVTFDKIQQFTFPSPQGGTKTPALQPNSPVVGACAPTFFGNTISLPSPLTITNPGNAQMTPPVGTVGIGPTGLLVEDNGGTSVGVTGGAYQTALGAGTGAVGLPKPPNPLDTGLVVGAQYLGFVYGSGVYAPSTPPTGWSSHLVSFGSTTPSNCPSSFPPSTGTQIYGGDFPNDTPSASVDNGRCDLAIDLGEQDPANNGLYPQANVWMSPNYPAYSSRQTYPFQAVAITGQLNGKYAIFLIGLDSTQPWGIYLLRSN